MLTSLGWYVNINDEDIVRAWNTYYRILQGHHTTTRKKVSRIKATSIDTILDLMQEMLAHLSMMCQDVSPPPPTWAALVVWCLTCNATDPSRR